MKKKKTTSFLTQSKAFQKFSAAESLPELISFRQSHGFRFWDHQQLRDRLAELWIDELRIKAYQIDDLLDEWSTAILKRSIEGSGAQLNSLQLWLLNVSIFFSNVCPHLPTSCFSFHDIPMRHDIAWKIKGFNAELDRLAEGTKRYREIGSSSNSQNNRFGASRITAHVLDTAVEGRELEKSQLLEFLMGGRSSSSCSKTPNIKIVSIVGLGGFGKTTLAQLVRKELKSGSFDKSIWVCVSNSFDETKVAKTILESLSDEKNLPDDLPKILEDLEKEVEVKNFFLVLDDVWEDSFDSWKSIMASLSGGLSGSRILVTTRKGSVAKTLSMCIHNININRNSNESSHTLELKELSMEACIKVFSRWAFFRWDDRDIKKVAVVAESMVREKCRGSPLAVRILGSFLCSKKSRKEWHKVLNSPIWSIEKLRTDLFAHMWFSYYDLSPQLRQCFSYCAIFPKDFVIRKDSLIKMWMFSRLSWSGGYN